MRTRGSIVRRGNHYRVMVNRITDGKRDPITRTCRTEDEAQETLTEILKALDEKRYVDASKVTVSQYLTTWIEGRKARENMKPSTWASYEMNLTTHIVPGIGDIRLQKLTATDLDKLYADLLSGTRRHRLSRRTVRYCHSIIRKALADAVRKDRVARNVADLADPPSTRATRAPEMRTWSAEELRTFLNRAREDRLYPAFLLAATTGLRRGELLGLRWHNVDLDHARIAVRESLVIVQGKLTFTTPKTNKSRRSVAIDPRTIAAIKEHRKLQIEERLKLGPAYQDNDLVFATEDGSPLPPKRLGWAFQRIIREAGVPRIRLHDVRHTHATLGLRAGIHPKVMSERLGHSTVAMTMDTYSHAIPALEEEAAAALAALVFGP
jgi:integrase